MYTMMAQVNILLIHIILVLVLVAVQNENSVFGHAQGQNFTSALQVRAA